MQHTRNARTSVPETAITAIIHVGSSSAIAIYNCVRITMYKMLVNYKKIVKKKLFTNQIQCIRKKRYPV